MFVCIECKQKYKEKHRVFVGQNWCSTCVDREGKRHGKEDSIPGQKYAATRPPKYMLRPDQYRFFGYSTKEETAALAELGLPTE